MPDVHAVLQVVLLSSEAARAVVALEVHSLCVLAVVPTATATEGGVRAASESAAVAAIAAAGSRVPPVIDWLPADAAPAVARAAAARVFAALRGCSRVEDAPRLADAWNATPLSLLHVGADGGAGDVEGDAQCDPAPPSIPVLAPAVNWAAVAHLMKSGFALGASAAVDGAAAPTPLQPLSAAATTSVSAAPRGKRRCGEVSLLSFSAAAGVQGAARVLPLPPADFSPLHILRQAAAAAAGGSPRFSLHGALVSALPPLAQPAASPFAAPAPALAETAAARPAWRNVLDGWAPAPQGPASPWMRPSIHAPGAQEQAGFVAAFSKQIVEATPSASPLPAQAQLRVSFPSCQSLAAVWGEAAAAMASPHSSAQSSAACFVTPALDDAAQPVSPNAMDM